MNIEEARAWLRGERSMTNTMSGLADDLWAVRAAEADAAMMQQAYWIVRAHAEGLIIQEQPQ